MDNLDMQVKGDKLTIIIDLNKPTTPSASGKTKIIASTRGTVEVPGKPGVKLNLSLHTK